jgi:hypothetical protein
MERKKCTSSRNVQIETNQRSLLVFVDDSAIDSAVFTPIGPYNFFIPLPSSRGVVEEGDYKSYLCQFICRPDCILRSSTANVIEFNS